MNEGQRLACLKWFNECTLEESKPAQVISRKGKEKRSIVQGVLIPTSEDASRMLSMPSDTVQGIWKKAINLCSNPAATGPIPGEGNRDCFVLSRSNAMPHAVTAKGNIYHCGNHCIHYHSAINNISCLCGQMADPVQFGWDILKFGQSFSEGYKVHIEPPRGHSNYFHMHIYNIIYIYIYTHTHICVCLCVCVCVCGKCCSSEVCSIVTSNNNKQIQQLVAL